jgi:hypothetical protein
VPLTMVMGKVTKNGECGIKEQPLEPKKGQII